MKFTATIPKLEAALMKLQIAMTQITIALVNVRAILAWLELATFASKICTAGMLLNDSRHVGVRGLALGGMWGCWGTWQNQG